MSQTHKTLKHFQSAFDTERPPGLRSLPGLVRIPRADRNYLMRRYWRGLRAHLPFAGGKSARDRYIAFEKDLTRFSFRQAGRVVVKFSDGSSVCGHCRVPPGFAGDPSREQVIRAKFDREAVPILGQRPARKIRESVDRLPNIRARQVLDGLPGD